MDNKEKVSLYAVGDVAVTRENPEAAFTYMMPTLGEPDILFGQLEVNLSQKGGAQFPTGHGAQKPRPHFASVLKNTGFDVLSFASNHCLDLGPEALVDTTEIAKQNEIALVGVGKNISEAREPAIFERKGVKIGFLAYNSILPQGYWATPTRPGCAPVRVRTFYEQCELDQPGSPPEIYTYAYDEDLQAVLEDIKKVRPNVDILVMSIHWGIHFMPAKLAMYQKQVGYAAIDAGVDLILGHHAHILKGIEVYKGKVIFYSLGNFAMDSSVTKVWPNVPLRWQQYQARYNFKIDPEIGGLYPFPPESRKTMMAKCIISDKKIEKVSFLPVFINNQNQPEPLSRQDEKFSQVQKYMELICEDQKLGTKFSTEGDEVVVGV